MREITDIGLSILCKDNGNASSSITMLFVSSRDHIGNKYIQVYGKKRSRRLSYYKIYSTVVLY